MRIFRSESPLPVEVGDTPLDSSGPAGSHADLLREAYLRDIFKPSIAVNEAVYKPYGAFEWKLNEDVEPRWTESLGEQLCIIDLDNRPFNATNELWNTDGMKWDQQPEPHGLSLGVLNHWLYGRSPMT